MRTFLLPREDVDVNNLIVNQMEEDGCKFCFQTTVDSAIWLHKQGENDESDLNTIRLNMRNKLGESLAENTFFDTILIACGKQPNTQSLNLEAAEVNTNQFGGIMVDNFLMTTNSAVYAAGDCVSTKIRDPLLWSNNFKAKFDSRYKSYAEAQAKMISKNAFLFQRQNWTDIQMPRAI